MKREPVFIKPKYKYKDEVKEHPIERLEFKDVPESENEKLKIGLKRLSEYFNKALSGVGRH